MIGQRVIFQDHVGTVRYEGPIVHEDRGTDVWLGVEWDDVSRGRHNGKVFQHVYFQTKNDLPSGSLLKKDKVNVGTNILDAIFLKYFKEIPENLHGILDEEIISELQKQESNGSIVHQSLQKPEEQKDEDDPTSKYVTVAGQKQVLVEFDQNAYFETGKHKKKMVEFYGFNEIWQKINNLKILKELSLNKLYISNIGKFGFIGTILPKLKALSLESNLLYSWHQIFIIGNQLPYLVELSLSNQVFRPLETLEELNQMTSQKVQGQTQSEEKPVEKPEQKSEEKPEDNTEEKKSDEIKEPDQIKEPEEKKESDIQLSDTQMSQKILNESYKVCCLESKKLMSFNSIGLFKNLKVLVLINMQLTWKIISQILPAFSTIQELVVCKNFLIDYDNLVIQGDELKQLRVLNLEDTSNDDFSKIQKAFGHLPNIDTLILNRNRIRKLCKIEGFDSVKSVSMEYNALSDSEFLAHLSGLKNLNRLNVRNNPLQEKMGLNYVRQRAIAEIGTLEWMNCSNLNKYERKDSEIFYMKSAFEQYFLLKQVPHYFYDYEDFLVYALKFHPRIPFLVKKYGNPYEIDITVQGDVKQAARQTAPKTSYFNLCIVAMSGKMKGKEPIIKKFQGATGIFPVKQVVSKLTGIPLKSVQVSIKIDNDSMIILMDESDRTLEYYGAMENSQIIVEELM